MALRGAVAVIFGIIALIWPGVTVLALAFVFGVYAIVDGVGALISAFRPGDMTHRVAYGLAGVLGLVAGVIVLAWPTITVLVLATLVGLWAVVTGIAEIIAAVRLRRQIHGEAFLIIAGAVSAIAGILILIHPIAGALGIAILVGIFAIVYGIVLLSLGFRLRNTARHRA